MGLAKTFLMPYNEARKLQFRWEVFNISNTAKFDVNSLSFDLGTSGTFGKYSGTLHSLREMQFALRYEF